MRKNGDVPWEEFDPEVYFDHNYAELRKDERQIVELIRDFFSSAAVEPDACGIDLGTGPNLYPAMAMLIACSRITLLDYSERNVDWLNRQLHSPNPAWQRFWDVFASAPEYRKVGNPWAALRSRVTVVRDSLFTTPERHWDMGTMFFVAESISANEAEFAHAMSRFTGCLKPGAPFAAAFMENSEGYELGGKNFPAVAVCNEDIRVHLERSASDLFIERVGTIDQPLRPGYTGMIVACGFAV
ncbi:MAG: putative N-methyltransferase [Actinomycetia bacterium]|nr:putative N-methyltransferase [Actinomycetes bacterium]